MVVSEFTYTGRVTIRAALKKHSRYLELIVCDKRAYDTLKKVLALVLAENSKGAPLAVGVIHNFYLKLSPEVEGGGTRA